MKLLKVENITLDEPLFYEDEFKSNKIKASSFEAIDGSEIVFESYNKNENLHFTHKEVAWQSYQTLNALINLANQSLGKTLEITTDSGEKSVRFDYTKDAVVADELFTGSKLFLVNIYFKGV